MKPSIGFKLKLTGELPAECLLKFPLSLGNIRRIDVDIKGARSYPVKNGATGEIKFNIPHVGKLGNLVGKYWPFGILDDFNISEDELWNALKINAKQKYFMYPDAKSFLIKIKQFSPSVKVYTATTNPRLIILAKLSMENIAGQNGSPYLDGAFGGEEVYPGGKATPEFFEALLERTGAVSETTLIVGDSPEMDLFLARSAGLKHVILPRRSQKEEWIHENDGGIYVKRLDTAFRFLCN